MRNSLNDYRLKQSKVLTLKHDGIQDSASVQFCPGYYSSEVGDLLSNAQSVTAEVIPRIEIWQKNNLGIDRAVQNIWNFVETVGWFTPLWWFHPTLIEK